MGLYSVIVATCLLKAYSRCFAIQELDFYLARQVRDLAFFVLKCANCCDRGGGGCNESTWKGERTAFERQGRFPGRGGWYLIYAEMSGYEPSGGMRGLGESNPSRGSNTNTMQERGERMAHSENRKWVRMVGVACVGENGKRRVWRTEWPWIRNDLVHHSAVSWHSIQGNLMGNWSTWVPVLVLSDELM